MSLFETLLLFTNHIHKILLTVTRGECLYELWAHVVSSSYPPPLRAHSLQPEPDALPFLYSQGLYSDTISNQESYWFEAYHIDLSLLLGMIKLLSILWFSGSIHRILFPIETLSFILSQSCVNSFVPVHIRFLLPVVLPLSAQSLVSVLLHWW